MTTETYSPTWLAVISMLEARGDMTARLVCRDCEREWTPKKFYLFADHDPICVDCVAKSGRSPVLVKLVRDAESESS